MATWRVVFLQNKKKKSRLADRSSHKVPFCVFVRKLIDHDFDLLLSCYAVHVLAWGDNYIGYIGKQLLLGGLSDILFDLSFLIGNLVNYMLN